MTSHDLLQCDLMSLRHLSIFHSVTQCPCDCLIISWCNLTYLWHVSISRGAIRGRHGISHYPIMQLDVPTTSVNHPWCNMTSMWHMPISYSVTQRPYDISHSPMVPTPSGTTHNKVNIDQLCHQLCSLGSLLLGSLKQVMSSLTLPSTMTTLACP